MIKPIYEFLLWDNCNNNCKFCFQRCNSRIFNLDQQKNILQYVIDYLESGVYEKNSHVLIVGGEIFDDQKRFDMLDVFFNKIIKKMILNDIDILYINTNLIYGKEQLSFVKYLLEKFQNNNLLNRLHFTTSYDLEGRFKSDNDEKLFLSNLSDITKNNQINVITNIILTNTVCNKILNDEFNLFSFKSNNNCNINLIPYIILDQALAASRNTIFKTIKKCYDLDSCFINNWIIDLDLKQPRKMIYFKNNIPIRCECSLSNCGHSENFKKYSDNNSCFVCDIKKYLKYYV